MTIEYQIDPFPSYEALNDLFAQVWELTEPRDFSVILARSLVHVAAFDGSRLIGFVNVATDGGLHAFLLDTSVLADYRRQGIGWRMVNIAKDLSH